MTNGTTTLKTWLTPSETKRLMQYNAWPVVRASLGPWILILATFYVCSKFTSGWIWSLGFFLMGIEQNALSVLLHESVHGFIHPISRVNDAVSAPLYAAPIFLDRTVYRDRHWQHHRLLSTGDDTKRYPRCSIRRYRFLKHVVLSLTGILAVRMAWTYSRHLKQNMDSHRAANLVLLALVQMSIMTLCWRLGNFWMYPVLWVMPIFTVMTLLVSLRSMAEHQPEDLPDNLTEDEGIHEISRTVTGNILSRFILAQNNFNYHHEHHLFPQIPFWNLPEFHELLKSQGYYYTHPEWLVKGYSDVFRTLIARD